MNKALGFAVVLPIAVLGAWVAKLSVARSQGTEVQFAVRGFDPRDLLAGHYLTYTVDYGPVGVCPDRDSQDYDKSSTTCMCLAETPAGQVYEATWVGACSERAEDCSPFIQGECRYGRFKAHIERFYFPEAFQAQLSVVPERSTIAVRLTASGEGLVTRFLVDGVDVVDYAEAKQASPE